MTYLLRPIMAEDGRAAFVMSPMDEQTMPMVAGPPVPPPAPRNGAGHASLVALVVILLVIISGAGGYLAAEYKHWERQQSARLGGAGDGFLRVPAEITVKLGEPAQLTADTNSASVRWQPLNSEISLAEKGPREVWVWAKKPGTYRLQVLAARNDALLGPELVTVKVEESKAKP